MNLFLILILLVYFNSKSIDHFVRALQTLEDNDFRDLSIFLKNMCNLIYSNWFFLCFFTISVILITTLTILVFKKKKMYFTKIIAFCEFVFYIILLISILNFNMEPRVMSEFMENGRKITFTYIYNDKEMFFRLFSIFIIPVILLLLLLYFFICLFYLIWKKKTR